jgi:hypothetical protein
MNEMLARAGAFFLAPATVATPVPVPAPAPTPSRAAVLAAGPELLPAAGAVAGALRSRNRASAAVVCVPTPRRSGAFALPAATAVARRLGRRDLECTAIGSLCLVHLPEDPAAFAVHAWRVLAAADVPAVLAIPRREAVHDELLSSVDLIAIGVAPDADPVLADVAVASLERLGPPVARVALPRGVFARRAAASGLLRAPLPAAVSA